MPWRGVAGEGQVEERGWAYRRRQPGGTVLYEAVRDNLATLLAEASKGHPRAQGVEPQAVAVTQKPTPLLPPARVGRLGRRVPQGAARPPAGAQPG